MSKVRQEEMQVLLLGDLNVKSPPWGEKTEDEISGTSDNFIVHGLWIGARMWQYGSGTDRMA